MSSLISISISLEIVDSPKVLEMEMEKLDDIWGKNWFFTGVVCLTMKLFFCSQ